MIRSALRIATTLLLVAPAGVSAQADAQPAPQAATQVVPADDPALERLARELARLAPISDGTVGVG